MIGVVLGSPEPAFRHVLAARLGRFEELEVLGDADTPQRLYLLVATCRPSLAIIDAGWAHACPDLLGGLLGRSAPPRVLVYADTLHRPAVLAAVKLGAHGCLPRDARTAAWHRAVLAVHAGESWIPRGLMAQALADLRRLLQAELLASPVIGQLTDRQREIVRWVTQGLSNKEIGRHMGISPTTVKTHLHNIFERAGISGRQHLTAHALRKAGGGQDAAPEAGAG